MRIRQFDNSNSSSIGRGPQESWASSQVYYIGMNSLLQSRFYIYLRAVGYTYNLHTTIAQWACFLVFALE